MNIIVLKADMRVYAVREKLDIPPVTWRNATWGGNAKTLAYRVSKHKTGHGTTEKNALWAMFNPAPKYAIRHDYDAIHHSGTRQLSVVHQIVLHDMEVAAFLTAAEDVGRYFEMQQSGGSTNLGVDNNSIQSYLDDDEVPWGAPYVNTSGEHIEQMGKANWTEAEWKRLAAGTLDRTAWVIARKSKKLGIPIRALTDEQLHANERGITTHRQCSRVFHIAGGHTDPGTGFPYKELLEAARRYA